MLSLKHVRDDGKEKIMEAVSVGFDQKANELIGYGCPDIEACEGTIRLKGGLVYVTNQTGATIGIYNLRTK